MTVKMPLLVLLVGSVPYVALQVDEPSFWQIVRDAPLVIITILALLALVFCLRKNGRR